MGRSLSVEPNFQDYSLLISCTSNTCIFDLRFRKDDQPKVYCFKGMSLLFMSGKFLCMPNVYFGIGDS